MSAPDLIELSFIPYSQEIGDIPTGKELERVLTLADGVLATLAGVSSCHIATQAWESFVGEGRRERGFYYPAYEHSWIDMGSYLLDLYPVGGFRPILVSADVGRRLYRPLADKDGPFIPETGEFHFLKIWTEYFKEVCEGRKTFEIRRKDRNFRVGDSLVLQEYSNSEDSYTGREVIVKVSYITDFYQKDGYVVIGFLPLTTKSPYTHVADA